MCILCRSTTLKGFLAEKKVSSNQYDFNDILDVEEGKKASSKICTYVDTLISTYNPTPPEDGWTKPVLHPCRKSHDDIVESDYENDYIDLLNTVQRHTHCSTKYCLKQKPNENNVQCRFNFPFPLCSETK